MQSLQLLFSVGLIFYSIYSVIVYVSRRSGNKGSLRQLRETGQPVRHLTTEELAYLQPFLVTPLKPGKSVELLGEEVYTLSGEFLRHGLTVSNGGETMHDTLGGIDVVLPYDARNFLGETNTAEVVLTEKFAIVIRLNEIFDLQGGRERAQLDQLQEQQWNAGQTGELPRYGENDSAAPENDATSADAEPDISLVRILGQRDETAAEAAARNHPDWGWLATLALTPAFVLLMIAGYSDDFWPWLVPSLLFLALAFWLIWHRRQPAARQKVNRVQGNLSIITLQAPSNSTVVRSQLFLGDKFPIVMPEHWRAEATVPADSQVTLEMRVKDYSVVRFGKELSIDTEEQRFPFVYWGRHLTLATAGIAMLLAAWIFNDHIAADLAHVRAGLFSGEPQTLTQADQVIAHPPAAGTMVRLQAQVRCRIPAIIDNTPPAIDCQQLRWGGEAPGISTVEVAEDLLQINSGAVLQAHSNPMLDIMLQMRMAGENNNPLLGYAAPRKSFFVVSELSRLILTIDQECTRDGIDNRSSCRQLQQTIGDKFLLKESGASSGWKSLLEQAKDGRLKKVDDVALVTNDTLKSLQQELHDVAAARLRKVYEKPLQAAIDSQQGGILLPLLGDPMLPAPATENTDELPFAPPAVNSADWQIQWANYQALAEPESLHPLALTGLVVAFDQSRPGEPVLRIDTERTQANYPPALLRLLAFVLGAFFLLVHGVLWLVNLSRAKQRSHAIEAYYAKQR
jgi:hypothetical protein